MLPTAFRNTQMWTYPLALGDVLARKYECVFAETIEEFPVVGTLVATGRLQHEYLPSEGNAGAQIRHDVSMKGLLVPLFG